MTKKELQPIYVSPQVETLEIKTQAIICQSGNKSMGFDDFGDGEFEER